MALISKWLLNGNANDAKGVNNGTPTGIAWVAGKSGQAAQSANVNDVISCGNNVSLQISSGTIGCTVKQEGAGSTAFMGLVVKDNAYSLYLYLTGGTWYLIAFDWGGTGINSTGISINDGKWHDVVMSFQSGVANGSKIYLDGKLVLTFTMTISLQTSPLTLCNVDQGTVFEQELVGRLDNAFVDGVLWTPAQVKNRYAFIFGKLQTPQLKAA